MSARAALAGAALLLAGSATAGTAGAGGSPVALALMAQEDGAPRLLLAQRAITRSWGLSDDSVYVVVPVPGWRSEGGALAMSALLPGTGQLYAGERSGWLYLLAEAGGWAAHLFLTDRADARRDEAAAYAGNPNDPESRWSLERWSASTQEDPDELARLYAADPDGFYSAIRSPYYAAGFASDDARTLYESLQDSADRRRRYARYAVIGLVINHAVAAFDALRAARIHNLPLRRNLELQIRPTLGGGAGFTAAVEGSF
jgi:hypothetical protein